MLPNPFALLRAAPAVTALIGSTPVRAYRHGSAPQNVVAPYLTWFNVVGVPQLALDEGPRIDNNTVQIDCWSDNEGSGSKGIETLAQAVRNAIEPSHHMLSFADAGRDPHTQRYRFTLTFSFWTPR